LASNLNRIGVDDSVIQRILCHSNVATTQNQFYKDFAVMFYGANRPGAKGFFAGVIQNVEPNKAGI
jgi:hypothetical protein